MPTRILVYSDYVCPFCFIAEQSSVVRLEREFDVEIDWRGFQLHPETPVGGMPLSALFPESRLPSIAEHLQRFAASFGIDTLKPQPRMPNTRRVLAATEYARDQGKLQAFRDAAMHAYWYEGTDLESDERLDAIATSVGLDASALRAASTSQVYLDRVDAARREAHDLGVDGIPTFFIGTYCVVGCQPYDVLARAARLAGATPRQLATSSVAPV